MNTRDREAVPYGDRTGKGIALIVAKYENPDLIIESIRTELQLDKPGNGILFMQDLKWTYGLR